MTQGNPPKQISLLSESTTFTRVPNPNGEGELLEIKVTTKVRTPIGVLHDTTQTFLLQGEDAADTLGSLRVIHNNLQLAMMKLQHENDKQEEAAKGAVGAQLDLNTAKEGVA